MKTVDLNCDLGESFGAYQIGMDDAVIPLISSANVACGMHAGDPVVMEQTVERAKKAGIAVGAHPGYPDLQGFGRRNMALSPAEVRATVIYQTAALKGFVEAAGLRLQHVKPHGAMYNMAAVDPALAQAIVSGIRAVDRELILLGLANSELLKAARAAGLPYASEVFADRAYLPDGTLVPRSRPDAMIRDEELAVRRVVRMVKEGTVEAVDGSIVPIRADSVCVHGDNEKALLFVERIREALEAEGILIAPLSAGHRTPEKA